MSVRREELECQSFKNKQWQLPKIAIDNRVKASTNLFQFGKVTTLAKVKCFQKVIKAQTQTKTGKKFNIVFPLFFVAATTKIN